jgi:hypothetical protein
LKGTLPSPLLTLRKCTLQLPWIPAASRAALWKDLFSLFPAMASISLISCDCIGYVLESLTELHFQLQQISIVSVKINNDSDPQPFRYVPSPLQVESLLQQCPSFEHFTLQYPSLGQANMARALRTPAWTAEKWNSIREEWRKVEVAHPGRVTIKVG